MKTLTIEDLSKNDEMDRTAMTHVSGGRLPQVMVDLISSVDDYTHPSMPGYCDAPCQQFSQILHTLTAP